MDQLIEVRKDAYVATPLNILVNQDWLNQVLYVCFQEEYFLAVCSL